MRHDASEDGRVNVVFLLHLIFIYFFNDIRDFYTINSMAGSVLKTFMFFYLVYGTCQALECYVCKDQENNKDKCSTTIKTCEQGEDACLTEVSWRTMPYWQRGADKQFYISKRCATRAVCKSARKKAMPYCTHIWYEDWRCVECCLGDRCNYYVILSGSTARSNMFLVFSSAAAILGIKYLLK